MRYDAVVFDNDGVLTTPTRHEALRRAMRAAYDEVGVSTPTDDHIETLMRPDVSSLRGLANEHGVDVETLWAARERAAIDAQLTELREGRKTLYDDVSTLESLSRPRAIVSNNQHETIENIVDHFDLEGFDPWYGREPTLEGIERKKPAPHYLERTIDEMGATEPLYVGDSWVDVAVADALGIDSAFIRRDHRDGYDLGRYDVEPDYEIETLGELGEL
ncbi:HAD family hydrolase [Natrononativus amylolyticus]|uniref:HAD family hydrolase n=1 Tax=Natrononativus amylolyticus TaxID=2963434 RepID=UPI0020CD824C|nr:HAD-IA family hydrolase [Natrononativus amylolyticus]